MSGTCDCCAGSGETLTGTCNFCGGSGKTAPHSFRNRTRQSSWVIVDGESIGHVLRRRSGRYSIYAAGGKKLADGFGDKQGAIDVLISATRKETAS